MSEHIEDGGPAFPREYRFGDGAANRDGMTLRDYFAAHAPIPRSEMELDDHCAFRYRYADAMLAARTAPEVKP